MAVAEWKWNMWRVVMTNEKHGRWNKEERLCTAQKWRKLCVWYEIDISLEWRQRGCHETNLIGWKIERKWLSLLEWCLGILSHNTQSQIVQQGRRLGEATQNPSRVALGNRRLKWYWPVTSNGQERSSGFDGKPRELNWSSLAGTCSLIYYYICLYLFVPDLPMTVLEYSGI